jgi:predicted Zn-dependent protease
MYIATSIIRQWLVVALCLFLAIGPVGNATSKDQPQAEPATVEFKFGKDDLDLLEQVELIDQRFDREGLVYVDEPTNAYLQRVGQSLLPHDLKLEHVVWRFRALRDPEPNAFALPNGSIYVNTGLMALADNESQLAAVLAHEITHVLRRHAYLQNRSIRKKMLTLNIINLVSMWNPVGGIAGLAIGIMASLSPFIMMSTIYGYSRDLEREADMKGVDFMMAAEYPPEEMVQMLQLLDRDFEGEQIKYFYNDHPQLKDRILYVSAHLGSKAEKTTAEAELKREQNAYLSKIEVLFRHDIQLAINAARFRTALYLSQKLSKFKPESSENAFWLGESYRALGPRAPELAAKELSNGAKKDAAKVHNKMTPEEEEGNLLATEAGQQNWKVNQHQAEESYLRALKLDHPAPAAHRGLGMLYEKLGRSKEAIDEYQRYLDTAPDAFDRQRIQHRVQLLKGP